MQETNKNSINEDFKKKERHIVSWSQQEDDILREQISLHGTENWAIIASNFKNKTTRQCRRRWYTYLNSDFKKGGWTQEEDLLLCEAQRIFGNKWTEIAKVVSGRTDNAVKNRFSTLCKKRAKYEAMAKENKSANVNLNNNKRSLHENGYKIDGKQEEDHVPNKKIRRGCIANPIENGSYGDRSHKRSGSVTNQKPRRPFEVLPQNHNVNIATTPRDYVRDVKEVVAAKNKNDEGTFLKKDDPKMMALIQQAELLSSLAEKVNAENTEHSLENAWKVLQDFLSRSKENDILRYSIPDIEFRFEDFKDLIEDLRSSSTEGSGASSWSQPDLHESPASSDYSTGSTKQSQPDDHVVAADSRLIKTGDNNCKHEEKNTSRVEVCSICNGKTDDDGAVSGFSSAVYDSPLQVTPLFRSLAAGIPSPTFSESERNFLLKTFGIESPSPCPSANPSQPPPCKRVLLHSL